MADQLRAIAQDHVELANGVLKINLNYTETSLTDIDSSVTEFHLGKASRTT